MKLTNEQAASVIAKLDKNKDKRRPCSICGNNNWILNDTIFEVREFMEGAMVIGGSSIMPIISVSCTECGHTRFISAIRMGIIDPNPQSKQDNEKPKESDK